MGDGEKRNALAQGERVVTDNKVIDWRFEQLRLAGYGHDHALVLAARADVDLHQACEMLARGCDPSVAYEVLS